MDPPTLPARMGSRECHSRHPTSSRSSSGRVLAGTDEARILGAGRIWTTLGGRKLHERAQTQVRFDPSSPPPRPNGRRSGSQSSGLRPLALGPLVRRQMFSTRHKYGPTVKVRTEEEAPDFI